MTENHSFKNDKNIPNHTIHRLSICNRCLELFIETEQGKTKKTISSTEISKITGINANQIRKDLAYFGEFGKRGIGYPIRDLHGTLKAILGSSRKWDIVLVGAGNLGKALVSYKGFQKRGFTIKGVFDNSRLKIGKRINGIEIYDIHSLRSFVKTNEIKVGIIAVPLKSAQKVANDMVAGGIKSILNFAPVTIKYPKGVKVNTIDISIELERLIYFLTANSKNSS
ncbi:MAG: redox-sensing transcriptional repressor Rex [Candidatus Atribacteria bacterium]|nr:redox-sensing transcriptional repressor Rex [Candidatus Atribacteria bacterium]